MTGPVIKALMISGVVMAFVPGASAGEQLSQKKGTTPYVTHFVFRPVQNIEVPGLGTAHLIEAVGTTQNMNGEKMLDKMAARCSALNVQSGKKKYIDGACTLTDKDGDIIFSTFDTRDVDKSQPKYYCGTHIITGGTGKNLRINWRGPVNCQPFGSLPGRGGFSGVGSRHK